MERRGPDGGFGLSVNLRLLEHEPLLQGLWVSPGRPSLHPSHSVGHSGARPGCAPGCGVAASERTEVTEVPGPAPAGPDTSKAGPLPKSSCSVSATWSSFCCLGGMYFRHSTVCLPYSAIMHPALFYTHIIVYKNSPFDSVQFSGFSYIHKIVQPSRLSTAGPESR